MICSAPQNMPQKLPDSHTMSKLLICPDGGASQNQEQYEDAGIKALSSDETLCVPLQLHYNGFAV